jgi:DNA replication protein DnaC
VAQYSVKIDNLLILDDFGLKPIQPPGHEDLYDVINERYEKGSILLTSNRTPSEWAEVFRDPLLVSASLDRLLDRAEVIILRGTSYRAQSRVRLNVNFYGDAMGSPTVHLAKSNSALPV